MRRHSAGWSGAQRGATDLAVLAAPSARAVIGAALLAALLLGGCAGGSTPTGGSAGTVEAGSSSQGPGDTETFTSPDLEPTTPETANGPAKNDNPAIRVARLPIGGSSEPDGTDPRLQCAHVTWIASPDGQIPRGTGIEITGVLFDPAAFEAVSQGCGSERPSCLQYVFRATALQCDLAVRARGEVSQDAKPTLGFAGLVFCPDNTSASCRRFVAALPDEQQRTVNLNIPALPPESTAPTTDPTTDSPTDSPTADSSTDTPTTDASTTDGG